MSEYRVKLVVTAPFVVGAEYQDEAWDMAYHAFERMVPFILCYVYIDDPRAMPPVPLDDGEMADGLRIGSSLGDRYFVRSLGEIYLAVCARTPSAAFVKAQSIFWGACGATDAVVYADIRGDLCTVDAMQDGAVPEIGTHDYRRSTCE